MRSADMSGRRHFDLSSFRGVGLLAFNYRCSGPLLSCQDFGYLGCRVACGIQIRMHFKKCVCVCALSYVCFHTCALLYLCSYVCSYEPLS